MSNIEDKKVGELWRDAHRHGVTLYWRAKCIDLIRKLVEERAINHGFKIWIDTEMEKSPKQCLDEALRDFGIDPATWPEIT